jgi:predicted dehydrogenase
VRRIIQVGLGRWGRDWAVQVVPQFADLELVGCVDSYPEPLEEAARAGIIDEGHSYNSLDAALDGVEADAVLVTTDLASHVPVVRAALLAGKHVLVEKPFAPSVAEARELAQLAEERQLTLMVSQNYRFFPAVRAVQQLVRGGGLGRVVHVDIDFRRFSAPLPGTPRGHRDWAQPLLVDMSIHHFDLLRAVLGTEPTSIYCSTWNPSWAGYKDPPEGSALIEFGPDLTVSYRGSWICPDHQTPWAGQWRMEFEQGEVWWTSRDDRNSAVEEAVWSYDHEAERKNLPLPDLPFVDRAGSLNAFSRALRDGEVPETSAWDNVNSLALTYAAVESARQAAPVPVGIAL